MKEQLEQAKIFYQTDQLVQAMDLLNQYIAVNHSDLQAILLRARINFRMQNWGEAMNDYSLILESDPTNMEAKSGFEMVENILGYFTPDMFNP